MRFPLGGQSKNFDSKKSRAEIVNLIPEADQKGDYKAVRRTEGLTLFASLPTQPVRSVPLVNDGFIYAVGGAVLYRVNSSGAFETLGSVGGSGSPDGPRVAAGRWPPGSCVPGPSHGRR